MGTFQQVSAGSLTFDSSCADKRASAPRRSMVADLEIKKTDFVSIVRRTSSSQDLVKKTITSGTVQRKTVEDGGPLKNMMTAMRLELFRVRCERASVTKIRYAL